MHQVVLVLAYGLVYVVALLLSRVMLSKTQRPHITHITHITLQSDGQSYVPAVKADGITSRGKGAYGIP